MLSSIESIALITGKKRIPSGSLIGSLDCTLCTLEPYPKALVLSPTFQLLCRQIRALQEVLGEVLKHRESE